jgi:hypothetical protein
VPAPPRAGVLFDVGHGGGSFLWPVAERALIGGFPPDTISTDLHKSSLNIQQSDMPNVMSKMMFLGMSFAEVLVRSTVNPAKEVGRYPELGTLGVGRVADIAVLAERTGVFAFKDSWPAKRLATRQLECVLTVRDGKVVYERTPADVPAGETQIYDVLIKHGRVANDEVDLALIGSTIARIGRRLQAAHARLVIEAEGYDVQSVNGGAGPCGEAAANGVAPVEGGPAQLALLESAGQERRCVLGIRAGRVVYDRMGLSIVDASRAGPYSNFK